MKRCSVAVLTVFALTLMALAHDAHVGVMNVDLGLNFAGGQKVDIKYRALNLGSGTTWNRLRSGELARPFPFAELTTSAPLKAGMASIPAGTHRLFFVAQQGGSYVQIGGDRTTPGPRVPVNVSPAPNRAEHLIIATTHGQGQTDFLLIMVYGDSMGYLTLDLE
jgi:hypothetical protein